MLWPRPDGERLPETVVIQASPQIAAYVADLGERAEAVRSRRVTPEEDNMLKISTDGRKAALDMRMVTGEASSTPSKLDVAAAKIAGIWREHRDNAYRDPASAKPSPRPGALQIVFCDLGTPRETSTGTCAASGATSDTETRPSISAGWTPMQSNASRCSWPNATSDDDAMATGVSASRPIAWG